MQPVSVPPGTGKVALQFGLIFGVIQGVIASIIILANTFVFNSPANLGIALLLSVLSFLTGLAAYFVAGIMAARQTGRVSTGTLAGLWTGAIYGFIGFVVSTTIFFQVNLPNLLDAASKSATYSNNMEAYRTGALIGGVGVAIFGILFAIGLGAGLGALGGLIGKNNSRFKPVQMVPVYVGQPYAAQPYAAQPDINQPYYGAQPMPYPPYPQSTHSEQINPEQ